MVVVEWYTLPIHLHISHLNLGFKRTVPDCQGRIILAYPQTIS